MKPWPQIPIFGGPDETPARRARRAPVRDHGSPFEAVKLTPADSQWSRACSRSDGAIVFESVRWEMACKGRGRWLFARWKNGNREHLVLCETDALRFAAEKGISLEGETT